MTTCRCLLGTLTATALVLSYTATARLSCLWLLPWMASDVTLILVWGLLARSAGRAGGGVLLLIGATHLTGLAAMIAPPWPRPVQLEGAMCEDFLSPLAVVGTPLLAMLAAAGTALLWTLLRWRPRRP